MAAAYHGRRAGGSSGGFNQNWDGIWEVRTRVGVFGWSAEFAIPFRTLRYRGGAAEWGLNFQRSIRRRKRAHLGSVAAPVHLYRVSRAGTLDGIESGAAQPEVTPYVLGERRTTGRPAPSRRQQRGGGDLKYS